MIVCALEKKRCMLCSAGDQRQEWLCVSPELSQRKPEITWLSVSARVLQAEKFFSCAGHILEKPCGRERQQLTSEKHFTKLFILFLQYAVCMPCMQFFCMYRIYTLAVFNRAHSEEHRMPQCNVVKRPFQFDEWTRNSTAQSFSSFIIWMDLTKLLKIQKTYSWYTIFLLKVY